MTRRIATRREGELTRGGSPHLVEGAALKRGDGVLVRYGRYAGRVGVVEDVFRREDAGRRVDVVWVRFSDRSVECFDPKNLMRREKDY